MLSRDTHPSSVRFTPDVQRQRREVERREMIELLGATCVAWTVFELARMTRAVLRTVPPGDPIRVPRSSQRAADPRAPRRFDAWDERGNRIVVEDLGSG